MLQTALSFGAGIATVASPCILPMLPLVLGAAVAPAGMPQAAARWRPALIVLGFVLSFASAALLLGAGTRVLGLSPADLRLAAAAVLLLCGLMLVWPRLLERAMAPLGGLADIAQGLGRHAGAGHAGSLLIGASLGLLWTPCAGPVLASILALVAAEEQPRQAALLLAAYAAGAGVPMLAVAYGGRALGSRLGPLSRHATKLRAVFGAAMMATAAAMALDLDASAAAWLSRLGSGTANAAELPREHAQSQAEAPEFAGIEAWHNTPPLTMAGLRGKVVLVDFWTYGCSNCINTLPHVERWHERYRERGLVVVGVHTPEFAYERDAAGVQAAIARHGLRYAVAQDNRYRTWAAWHNQYWPALYLVNREGRVVFSHAGEGDYELIEQQIRTALDQGG